jgi:hypothetical protein
MPAEGTIAAAPLKDAIYPEEDRFLSEEDLDLANLSWDELIAVWNAWLRQAAITDEADAHLYSHGVFTTEPR